MLRLSLALAVTAALLAAPTASAAARPFAPRPIHTVSKLGVASPRPLAHAAQAGSTKWIEGGLKYQYGTNCVILGGAYTEPMVASYVRYGGLDHLPRAGEAYTASIVVGVTGNPCPFGYGYVYTELVLPRGTQPAPGQAIQCLGVNRNGVTTTLTNATWSDPSNPSLTGRYCPAQPSNGSYGGIGFGFRPLAQGQIFELRVKVVSSVALTGGADTLAARIEATGVYSNPAAPSTPITVLPQAQVPAPVSISYPNPPYISAAPATPGAKATTTLRGLTYTGFRTGYAFFRIYDAAGTTLLFDGENPAHCAPNVCRSPLAATNDLWISEQRFDFDPSAADRYQFTLAFRPAGGALVEGPKTVFRPWKPDADTDGVPDTTDRCRNVPSPESNDGCPLQSPPPDADLDGVPDAADGCPAFKPAIASLDGCSDTDHDGVRDDQDACPDVAAATPTGCPPPTPPQLGKNVAPPPDRTAPVAKVSLPRGPRKASSGLSVTVACSEPATATVSLSVTKSTARRLRLPAVKGSRTVTIAQATGNCSPKALLRLRLRGTKPVERRLRAYRGTWVGVLNVALTDGAGNSGKTIKSVRLKR